MAGVAFGQRQRCLKQHHTSRAAVAPSCSSNYYTANRLSGSSFKAGKGSASFWDVAQKQAARSQGQGSSAPRRKQYEKIVYITNPITEDLANQMTALALYLDSRDKKRIYWWINSPGGDVTATLALHDTMQYLRCKSATVGYGMCLGMSGLLLATGEKGYRYAWPNTILMMHHPSGVARGQASDMHNEMKELVRQRDYLTLLASHSTGQPYDKVLRDMSRNLWMTPKEAVDYGMIDTVLFGPRAKKSEKKLLGPAFKFARQGEEDVF